MGIADEILKEQKAVRRLAEKLASAEKVPLFGCFGEEKEDREALVKYWIEYAHKEE